MGGKRGEEGSRGGVSGKGVQRRSEGMSEGMREAEGERGDE